MLGDVIARLAVLMTFDGSEVATGSTEAQRHLAKLRDSITGLGDKWVETGKRLSTRMTLPIAGLGAGIIAVAADFETGMNKVAISTQAGTAELAAMRKMALDLGKDSVFGASEAADAMDMLAKSGLDATQILGGAAKATVDLAAAAGSGLEPAANAITDVMAQFKLGTDDLGLAVDQITGAVNESKFSFNDYSLAIGQAGGVAGAAGVDFTDFNAALAGTSSLFASGSDAGTSFKTFLTSLPGKSSTARGAIETLGLKFYDANGALRSMAEIAQELQDKLAGLSEVARQEYLTQIFGTDAMRTAIGLMDLGADGLERIKAGIQETDAAAQAAQQMQGFNAQLETLKGAFETLAIAIADTGLLTAITTVVTVLANFISKLAETSPFIMKIVVGAALLVAALGPLMVVTGTLAAFLLPLFLARLSPIGIAIAALINPLGTAAALVGQFAVKLGGMLILKTVAAWLLRFLGPIGLIATAGYLIYSNWDKIAPVFQAFWHAAKQALGPPIQELIATISAAFSELWAGPLGEGIRWAMSALGEFAGIVGSVLGQALLNTLKQFLDVAIWVFQMIGDGIRIVNALLAGDWDAGWNAAVSIVRRLFGPMGDFVAGVMQRMEGAIKVSLAGIKQSLFAVLNPIATVKNAFFNLYDAVVGHSYIPDMVDGIAAQMQRLGGVMVQPVTAATSEAEKAFRDMAGNVKGILDRLYPEVRRLLGYRDDLATLEGSGLTGAQKRDARYRLGVEFGDAGGDKPVGEIFSGTLGPDMEKVGRAIEGLTKRAETARVQVVKSFKDMADGTLSALSRLHDSIRSGGFLGILESVIGFGLQLGSIGVFGKSVAGRINGVPAYASGTNFHPGGLALVGERGPELVTMPRGSRVTPNHELGGRQMVEIVDTTGLFQFRVTEQIAQAAPAIAQAGGQVGMANMAFRQSRSLSR